MNFLVFAALAAGCVSAEPILLKGLIDNGIVAFEKVDNGFLKALESGIEAAGSLRAGTFEREFRKVVDRLTDRMAEGEERAAVILSPVTGSEVVLTPVKATESVMNDLMSKGRMVIEAVDEEQIAAKPFQFIPTIMAKISSSVEGLKLEEIPLMTENAVHNAVTGVVDLFQNAPSAGEDLVNELMAAIPYYEGSF